MSKKKNTQTSKLSLSGQSIFFIALGAFVAGFLAGVTYAVYKEKPSPMTASSAPPQNQSLDYSQMAEALESEVAANPENLQAWTQLGHIYFDTGQYHKAIEAYQKSLELNPDNPDVLTDLGVMYRRTQQPEKAVETFDKAIAVDPRHETARLNKGIVLMHDLNDPEGAIRAWEQLLEINPLAMAGKNQSVDQLIKHYKEHQKEENQ